jgi:protein gp37
VADGTGIEYVDSTLPVNAGCEHVSEGCRRCFAATLTGGRLRHLPAYEGLAENGRFNGQSRLLPERLRLPLRWRNPRRIFVSDMADLFYKRVPDEYIAEVFGMMAAVARHTFLVLTKRHTRLRTLLSDPGFADQVYENARAYDRGGRLFPSGGRRAGWWPLPNVHVGVSVEDQHWANIRIPVLLDTPAAVRWISAEPLLGPIALSAVVCSACGGRGGATGYSRLHGVDMDAVCGHCDGVARGAGLLDWIVVGGETGAGARPMHPDWVRRLRDEAEDAGVPFFFKQWGDYITARVEDDPAMAGGRAFDNPNGGRSAAIVRSPGPSGTMRNAVTRPMRPGDRTKGLVMLDADTVAVRVGKARAGALLDGREHRELPEVVAGRG